MYKSVFDKENFFLLCIKNSRRILLQNSYAERSVIMKKNKRTKIKDIIWRHIANNSKEYMLVSLVFIVGIFLGVMFINNIQETQMHDITTYLNEFIEKLKDTEQLNSSGILKTTIIENIILAITLWFFGTTVIRNTSSIWNNII